MIEEKIIKVPQHESKQITYICDTCGKRLTDTSHRAMKRCHICRNEVCSDCAIFTTSECLINGSFDGDYPDYYCPKCWNDGAEIRTQILKSREVQEDEEDKLWEQWHKLCVLPNGGGE